MKKNMKTGVAWFEPDQWDELKAVSVDSSKLGVTYEEWLTNFERTVAGIQATGIEVEKVRIDITELVVWSKMNDVRIDGAARSGFVVYKLGQLEKNGNLGI